ERAARRRRRSVAKAAAGGVPPRHLPLVLRRRAAPVVVARPAHGALLRRAQGFPLARQEPAEQGLRAEDRFGVSAGPAGLFRQGENLARKGDEIGLPGAAPGGLRPFLRNLAQG